MADLGKLTHEKNMKPKISCQTPVKAIARKDLVASLQENYCIVDRHGQAFLLHLFTLFICRPSDSTVSEDAGTEPRTVETLALAVRPGSHHSAKSHPLMYW
jgi:hypothetical protein